MIFFLAGAIQVLLGRLRVDNTFVRALSFDLRIYEWRSVLMIALQVFPLVGEPACMHISDVMNGLWAAIHSIDWRLLRWVMHNHIDLHVPKISKVVPSRNEVCNHDTWTSNQLWTVPLLRSSVPCRSI